MSYSDYLQHHGIKGMKWGDRNGPPYPLTDVQRSLKENKLNTTSASAKHLASVGVNNRFNIAEGGRAASRHKNDTSASNSSSERKEGNTYHDTLTRESRMEMLKRKNPDQYKEKDWGTAAEESSGKSSKSSKTKEQLEAEERKKWIKDSKTLINRVFSDDIDVHSFKDLLDEFYNGVFSKNFDGKEDIDVDNLVDSDGNPMELSEGQKFYVKLMSRMDSKDERYSEYVSALVEILNDEDSESMYKLSSAISILADYADYLETKNRSSEYIKAYSEILGNLNNKLRWFNELRSTKSTGKRSWKMEQAYEEIEEYLEEHGF